MAKTFTHIGVATFKGKIKFRFTQGRAEERVKTMTKEGFTNIEFLALPRVMTKEEAFQTDLAQDLAQRHKLEIPQAGKAPTAEAA